MKRNERLDTAIRNAVETAGCLDEDQLAGAVARALRKEGMLSITPDAVIEYLRVHGEEILGPPVEATQLEIDFVHIQQRLANRIQDAESDQLPRVLARGLAIGDPVAVALGGWLQDHPEQEFKISEELMSLLRAAEAKLLQ